MSEQKSIPWYRSTVLMASVIGLLVQTAVAVVQGGLLTRVVSGDEAAIGQLAGIASTALVAFFRIISGVQPISIGGASGKAGGALLIAGLSVVFMSMSGCSSFRENRASVQLVTQYSVAKYLEGKSEGQARYEAAARIIKIAEALKQGSVGTEVRLDLLRVYVLAAIDREKLGPADSALARGLSEVLLAELEARFGNGGPLNPDQVVVVNQVLDWVIAEAARVSPLERPQ